MKKIILMSTVLLAGLSACEDYNDQFNIDYDITDIKTGVTIQLASSDYGTIAGMEANKELALSKDPEGQSYVTALEAIICPLSLITNIPMPMQARASRCNIICIGACRVTWRISSTSRTIR